MLNRQDILAFDDLSVKEITVPNTIPVWGGNKLFIRQLNRGQQDTFLKRQFGEASLRQDRKATHQEFQGMHVYGHDAWLCVMGICNEAGELLFTAQDIPALEKKNGEAIGWIATQILDFSNLRQDLEEAQSLKEKAAEDIKN
jgi:hypothetical protein